MHVFCDYIGLIESQAGNRGNNILKDQFFLLLMPGLVAYLVNLALLEFMHSSQPL